MVGCQGEGGLYSVRKRKSKRDYLKESNVPCRRGRAKESFVIKDTLSPEKAG